MPVKPLLSWPIYAAGRTKFHLQSSASATPLMYLLDVTVAHDFAAHFAGTAPILSHRHRYGAFFDRLI
jgi:hypothetical protein